ncbi:hypothetical protein Busp01_46210 [Trinickia caryophylli]|nr:hypothetical protein Busp01_46210 [Trinickia caryophylli]
MLLVLSQPAQLLAAVQMKDWPGNTVHAQPMGNHAPLCGSGMHALPMHAHADATMAAACRPAKQRVHDMRAHACGNYGSCCADPSVPGTAVAPSPATLVRIVALVREPVVAASFLTGGVERPPRFPLA